jgi:hypothetical protein
VADIGDLLLACDLPYIVDLSRCIYVAHVLEAEGPILLLVFVGIKKPVLSTVLAASLVADPYVIALPRQLESRSHSMLIYNPAVR